MKIVSYFEGIDLVPTCLVKYVLNYNINLPNDYSFSIKDKKHTGYIKSVTIEGRDITSYRGDDLSWTQLQPKTFSKVENAHKDSFIARKYFEGGVIDYSRYTIFEVMFNISTLQPLINNEVSAIQIQAEGLLKKFFDVYRICFGFSMLDLNISDSPSIEFYGTDEDLVVGINKEMKFTKYTERVQLRSSKFDDRFDKAFSKENLDQFQSHLKSDYEIALYEKMLLNSKEQISIYNNYALSIVLSETAFECFLQEFLIGKCEERNISELPVGRGAKHYKNYKEAIVNGNVTEHLIKEYLKTITNKNIAGSIEYNSWYADTYNKRNEIIHRGNVNITQDDAKKSFDSVVALINKIMNIKIE